MTINNLYYQKYQKYKNKYFNLQNQIVSKYHNNIQYVIKKNYTNKINNKYYKLLEKQENEEGNQPYHQKILNAIKNKDYTDINTKNIYVNNLIKYHNLVLSTHEITPNEITPNEITPNEITYNEYLTLKYLLKTNKKLKTLRLIRLSMPQNLFEEELSTNTTLEKLEFNMVSFNIAIIGNALITNNRLTTLIIINTNFTDADFTQFCIGIKQNRTLKILILNNIHNGLSNLMATELGLVLKTNETLVELYLESNRITHEGFITIGDALKSNKKLSILNLNNNNIDITSLTLTFLSDNNSITKLYLTGNKIDETGIAVIAKILKENTKKYLDTLYLENSKIGYEGVIALADALITNKTLKALDIGGNNIGIIGAKVIANALEKNKTLNNIYMYNNSITDDGAIALANALITNTTLKELDIGENNIGIIGAIVIANALEKNKTLNNICIIITLLMMEP